MKTLVYFASGRYKEKYQELPFDRIYLIDYCYGHRIIHYGKVTCMGRDCLTSIRQLKIKKVKIDYFIAVNEGLFEGGGKYPINSDMFLGYVMPLLNDKYYHIMDKEYYGNNTYHVSMDLPFKQVEINEHDVNYLSPYLFSENSRRRGTSKVFRMEKNRTETKLILNDRLRINVIHDSIWVDYDNLELVALSITEQGQGDFFKKIPKAILINETPFSEISSNLFSSHPAPFFSNTPCK